MGERQIKKMLPQLLRQHDLEIVTEKLRQFPAKYSVSALLSGIYQTDEVIKWKSIQTLAIMMDDLTRESMEDARLLMRRILWSLNEESGGIGWGGAKE